MSSGKINEFGFHQQEQQVTTVTIMVAFFTVPKRSKGDLYIGFKHIEMCIRISS